MMHTGALFLMSDEQPMSRSCLYLHTYHITVFLITVLVTLLSITVSSRSSHRRVLFYEHHVEVTSPLPPPAGPRGQSALYLQAHRDL